ncbi:MAG: hypothetical protein DRJ37_05235 [Thermoprotei archaeon]|nr:MAG: hypothetical protein DRJ37_05235 [Thermoprotei archaeon]
MEAWIKPCLGLWLGFFSGKRNKEDEEAKGDVNYVHGITETVLGILLGLTIGIGESFGILISVVGAFSILSLVTKLMFDFSIGFIGIGIGLHIRKKFGIGILLPVLFTVPLTAFILGLLLFILSYIIVSYS